MFLRTNWHFNLGSGRSEDVCRYRTDSIAVFKDDFRGPGPSNRKKVKKSKSKSKPPLQNYFLLLFFTFCFIDLLFPLGKRL